MRMRFREPKASAQRSRAFMLGLGLIGVTGALSLVWVGFNSPNSIPGRGYYTVEAEFLDADNVANHSQVRIEGKLVGQVLKPRVENGKAVVDLQIDPEEGPLKSDTKVEVRPRSPVGVRYIDITPGTRGTDLPDGGRIPSENTSSTRPLDEVLDTLDPETRVRTQAFLRELGRGAADRGEGLNEALRGGPEFLRGTDRVVGAVAERDGAMTNLIRGAATISRTFEPVRETIRAGFEPEAKALRPFSEAGDGKALQETLDVAPGSLGSIRASLAQTDPFVDNLAGFASGIRPALRAAPASLAQTSAMLREARPGLRAADETLQRLSSAVNPTLALLDSVRPALPRLDGLFEGAGPIAAVVGRYGCDVVGLGANWTSMLTYGNDTGGGTLRFNVIAGPESVSGLDVPDVSIARDIYPQPCTTETPRGLSK